jgi:hypothetical protein
MLQWSAYNIYDSGASENLTTNTFNSDVNKYYVAKKHMVLFLALTLVNKPVK